MASQGKSSRITFVAWSLVLVSFFLVTGFFVLRIYGVLDYLSYSMFGTQYEKSVLGTTRVGITTGLEEAEISRKELSGSNMRSESGTIVSWGESEISLWTSTGVKHYSVNNDTNLVVGAIFESDDRRFWLRNKWNSFVNNGWVDVEVVSPALAANPGGKSFLSYFADSSTLEEQLFRKLASKGSLVTLVFNAEQEIITIILVR